MSVYGSFDNPVAYVSAINDHGVAAGFYSRAGYQQAFTLQNGVRTDIGPRADRMNIISINNGGQALGFGRLTENDYRTPDRSHHGGLSLPNGIGTEFRVGGGSTSPYDINDNGQIVGVTDGGAFLYQAGSITMLSALPGNTPTPWAINNAGDIVGSAGYSGASTAVLWHNGAITDIGAAAIAATSSVAYDINETGTSSARRYLRPADSASSIPTGR